MKTKYRNGGNNMILTNKEKVFSPRELKTIEIDAEKKIFKINGEEFGRDCTGFTISCTPDQWSIRAEIETSIVFTTYDSRGDKKETRSYEHN